MRRAEPNRSMTLNHQQAQELIQKGFQARLEGFERTSLEAHLAGCAECAAYAAQARGLDQRLSISLPDRWPEPRYTAAELQRRQASVHSRLRRNTMLRNLSSFARLAGTAAVLLVVIAGLGWLALRGAPRPLAGGLPGGLPDMVTPAATEAVMTCDHPTYQVVEGDTLSGIAAQYGVTVDEIRKQNGIDGDQFNVGQVLIIPTCVEAAPANPASTVTPSSTAPAAPAFDLYTVQEGDTCGGIAFQNNIALAALIQFNGLTEGCEIFVGQQLRFPRPTPTPLAVDANRIDLEEAERLVREYVYASQPGMNANETFPLQELTTDETWQRMRAQVYKVSEGVQQYQSYVIIDGQVYPIGESFGGMGVHTLLVTDLNNDASPELIYAYSFGSGIHQSSIGMLRKVNGAIGTFAIVDFRYLGELRLEKQDDQTVRVTGIPDSGGEQELGRLVLLGTQLVITPGDAALVEFSSPEHGVSFLIPETWQSDPGAHFSLVPLEMDDYDGNLSRACEWEANRDGAPYGLQPRVLTTSLGEREACVVMPDGNAGELDWSIFFASGGKIIRLTVEAAYAQVVGQSFRFLEPLATATPQPVVLAPRPPSLKAPESRALGSLTLGEYAVVSAAEDTPTHFEYNARILDTVFLNRNTWTENSMEDTITRANEQLKPFGYKLVERKDASNSRIDLYWGDNVLRESLSMFYPPSVYFAGNDSGGISASNFAMVVEDKNYNALLVQASPNPDLPLIGNYDLMNSRYTRPVMAGPRLISARRGYSGDGGDRVDVLADGEVIFTYTLAPSAVEESVKKLDEWNGGWVLEVNGTLIVDGANWNQKELQADEIFNWTKIHGKPFFFFRRDGKISAWYDGQELPMDWEEIIHYRCCEPAAFNVVSGPDGLWFHARRDGMWYFAEIKK